MEKETEEEEKEMSPEFRTRGKGKNRKVYPINEKTKSKNFRMKAGKAATPKKSAQQIANKKWKKAWDQYQAGEITQEQYYRRADRYERERKRAEAPTRNSVMSTMKQRAIAQGAPTSDSRGYNGWTNWDTWETMLLLDNTQKSNQWLDAWNKNWTKKIKAGTFDPEKAETVVAKYLVPAARGRKSLSWAVGPRFTSDDRIDPKKVNKAEIVHNIIAREE